MSDWIKLRSDLDTDPRVFAMGEHLRQSAQSYILTTPARDLIGGVTDAVTRDVLRDVTLAALSRVWFAANRHTKDGVFHGATLDYLDSLALVPGFGRAMESVGYAVYAAGSVTLPRFEEYNAPNKNGQRSKSSAAIRMARMRERQRQSAEKPAHDGVGTRCAASGSDAPASPEKEKSDGNSDVTRDVTPSYSSSLSISDSNSESDSEKQPRDAPKSIPPPAPPVTDPLGALKKRINALRQSWSKAPHWNAEEDHALFEARHNLTALHEEDWQLLTWFFRWVHSTANTATQNPVSATTKRKTLISELSSYLDRAATAWRQAGRPRIVPDATKPIPAPAPPPPKPEDAPTGPTDVFKKLTEDLRIPPRPENPAPASKAPTSPTLPPPDFDSPAYRALVASHQEQPTAA